MFRSLASCLCLLLACTAFQYLLAEPPQDKFKPNYVATEDVTLSSPNGKRLGSIKKGTLVSAQLINHDLLNLTTKEGQFGMANCKSFSQLSISIPITQDAKVASESNNPDGARSVPTASATERQTVFLHSECIKTTGHDVCRCIRRN